MSAVSFQIETLQIVTGLLYIAFPMLSWVALQKTALPSLKTWSFASLMGGVGLACVGLGGLHINFNWLVLGQILLMYSFMLRTQALRLDRGETVNHRLVMVLSSCFALILILLNTLPTFWAADLWIRTGNFFVVWFFIVEIRRFALAFKSRSARTMMWVYILLALALTKNFSITLHSVMTDFQSHQILGSTLSNSLAIFVASIVGHMSYLGMTAERSIDKLASAREQYQKSKAWQEKAQELSLMDRQLSLGLIANSLTHAISQPLSSMLIHTRLAQRLLLNSKYDKENLVPHIELIATETKRTSETIENIRRFIRPIDNKPQDFTIAELLQNVRQLMYQEALIQNVEIKWSPEEADRHWFADLTQITQACLIILQKILSHVPYSNTKAQEVIIAVKAKESQIKLIFIYPGPEIDIKSLEIAQMIASVVSGSIYRVEPQHHKHALCMELQEVKRSHSTYVHATQPST